MFVDKVNVTIRAGKGGNGKLSFRHEKFVNRGGPDGGDGGSGGNVVVEASNNQNTLANFRFKKLIEAENGGGGEKRKKHGKKGVDLIVQLPVGTVVTGPNGELADLVENGQRELIAKGGQGGFGNAHFTSSTRQAPRVAEKGEPGEELEATFELKMIADVGLVGLPNAGKSTLLSKISNARPEIDSYPFTTLKPNLGVVDIDESTSVLFADIPGLIKGASQGKGLGDEFLRHVERTKLLVHLIDIYQDDLRGAYKTILKELENYSVDLSKRPQIIVLNKIEGFDNEIVHDQLNNLKKIVKRGTKILPVSAQSGQGINEMLYEIKRLLKKKQQVSKTEEESIPVIKLEKTEDQWKVEKKKSKYIVTGEKIERFAHKTDFESYDAIARLKDIMRKMGIAHELDRQGAEPDDVVILGQPKIGEINY